jgi:LmbE family N-acetylglucosaminyl deacetylase
MTVPINYDPTGRRLYVIGPHADDDVLFFAKMIAHCVLAGREVHGVLMSNGETSNVLGELNGTAADNTWWKDTHSPAHEGYAPLTAREFGLARTREWRNSWHQLGVPDERLHLGMDLATSDLLPDAISTAYAMQVMQYYVNGDLDAGRSVGGLYTMHWNDVHPDHAACGQALRTLRTSDPTYGDSRWMVKPEEAAAAGAAVYGVPDNLLAQVTHMQWKAAQAYGAWAPADPPDNGSFAIGFHSVYTPYFTSTLAGGPNHIVRNP